MDKDTIILVLAGIIVLRNLVVDFVVLYRLLRGQISLVVNQDKWPG